ncbi:hypothetical protein L873DRAFT_1800942, partial [Choiromyces venosus 120613-1]
MPECRRIMSPRSYLSKVRQPGSSVNRESHTAGSDLGLVPRFMAVWCEASWFV